MRWAAALMVMLAASGARAATPVTVQLESRSNPALRLHVATIDLSNPSVTVRLVASAAAAVVTTTQPTGWETALALPTAVADREHFCVAVNGNLFGAGRALNLFNRQTPYFVGNPANVLGWAMTDGHVWATAEYGGPALVVFADGHGSIGIFKRLPDGARQAVGGSNLLVASGCNVATANDKNGKCYPRTAVGVENSGRRLILIVVDGHRAESVGMTMPQLADEMIRLGCADALALDGGGSSVMVRSEGGQPSKVISVPSDGHDLPIALRLQRPVASVLGICCSTEPTTKP